VSTVGFIGFGVMGAPMATNLARAGFSVVGYSRTRSKVEACAAAGIVVAESLEELVQAADVIVTMLPNADDVESVVFGADGVFAHATQDLLFIDMSTIPPDVAARFRRRGNEQGFDVLDAPVSGGESGAIEAALSIMVGGTPKAYARARPILGAMGRTVVHVGDSGAGQTVKAANQLVVATNMQGLAEAIVFLEAHDVALEPALKAIGSGLAGSSVIEQKSMNMVNRSFTAGARLELFRKDLDIVLEAARERGVAIFAGSLVSQVINSLVTRGDGNLDHSAMIRFVDDHSRDAAR